MKATIPAWSVWRFKRSRRDIGVKLRLTMALLVAAGFSIATPRKSWGRVRAALATWLQWARGSQATPFWIYYHRLRACHRCPLYYSPLRTCGTPLVRDLRDIGCHCNMEAKSAVIEATCWFRDNTNNDTEFGWPSFTTRLSGIPGYTSGRESGGPGKCSGCGGITA